MIEISIILPTHNPNLRRLMETLNGLRNQTLQLHYWELIIVDNNSQPPINVNIDWHPNHQIITENNQGLTPARISGFKASSADIIVMVDDDNILSTTYLESALSIFKNNVTLGAAGGKIFPVFEAPPPSWLSEFHHILALRNYGDDIIIKQWDKTYPSMAPVGAGMVIRKEALQTYLGSPRLISDRKGNSLSSGGDNDIVLEILKSGWEIGYYPNLKLSHIISKERTTVSYISKLMNSSNKSWIQLLSYHQINPWKGISKLTLPLRKIRSWFNCRAWKNDANYIRWCGTCGTFDGLANVK
ncbi:MAG: glycosyltransferase family 2 protein [Pedobacter sp.]|nr:MAG: glycosyltransferase family 2 protein [Pedobacter sp.]